jgi:hypothetical protein
MTVANRVLPINWATAGEDVRDLENKNSSTAPRAAIQSITMALRFGDGKEYAIGYIKKFSWTAQRDKQVLHQIEPYPNGTFTGNAPGFGSVAFKDSKYWPGEPVEMIPGKMGAIEIELQRYALYSSNLLRTLLTSDGAGTEHNVPVQNNSDIHYSGDKQNEYVSLIQQTRPVFIYQTYINPLNGKIIFGRVFEECWFTDIGEEIADAEKNEAIIENGKLTATRLRPYVI